jgi:dTDP-glucose 4,6-dehydratase
MRILVTGGAGFIGSNFVHHLLEQGSAERIVVLDALTYAGNMRNLAKVLPKIRFVHDSINRQDMVAFLLREEAITHLVHFAAESHVDRSIHAPDAFVETNVVGTHSLLKACREVWKDSSDKLFLHVSTDEVFGSLGPNDPPFNEKTPYAPNSPYSATKAASDHLVRSYQHTYGLQTCISNCSNNYGPYQLPEKLIALTILNILAGKNIPIYGDGLQIRDWLHVADHCRALELILKNGKRGDTYCVGGNNECTNIEIVNLLCEIMSEKTGRDNKKLITYVADRPGHDRRYAIDNRKISKELCFAPKQTLESGLRSTVEWYLQNEHWWKA